MPSEETQFRPGKSPNPGGKRKEPVYDQEEVPEPGLEEGDLAPSALLRDLRWAYRNFGVRCRGSPQQMAMRSMLEGDRVKFMDLLTKHEQMHASKVEKRRPAAVAGPQGDECEMDEGTMAALELVEKVLKGVLEEKGGLE